MTMTAWQSRINQTGPIYLPDLNSVLICMTMTAWQSRINQLLYPFAVVAPRDFWQ